MRTRIALLALILLLVISSPAQAAIVTFEHSSFGDGIVTITFDYNTGNGNVLRFTCTNNSDFAASFRVYEDVGGVQVLRYEKLCPGHTITIQNVAGTTLAWDLIDGGLMMGPYTFGARWPET